MSPRRSRKSHSYVDIAIHTEESGFLCKKCMRPPSLPDTVRPTVSETAKALLLSFGRRRRSGQGLSSRISTDLQSEVAYDNAAPILSSFVITPPLSVSLSLQWAMKHWNMPRIAGSCCPWHTAVFVAKTALDNVANDPCDPLWCCLGDWQCAECCCLNHNEVMKCDMCSEPRPALQSDYLERSTNTLDTSLSSQMRMEIRSETISVDPSSRASVGPLNSLDTISEAKGSSPFF